MSGAKKYQNIKMISLVSSVIIFCFSLTQLSFCTNNGCTDSITAFVGGWYGALIFGAGIVWIANPLLIIGWIVKPKIAIVVTFLSTILCFSFLFFDSVIQNEAGMEYKITSYKMGYWLWCSSSIIAFVGNIFLLKTHHLKEQYEH